MSKDALGQLQRLRTLDQHFLPGAEYVLELPDALAFAEVFAVAAAAIAALITETSCACCDAESDALAEALPPRTALTLDCTLACRLDSFVAARKLHHGWVIETLPLASVVAVVSTETGKIPRNMAGSL